MSRNMDEVEDCRVLDLKTFKKHFHDFYNNRSGICTWSEYGEVKSSLWYEIGISDEDHGSLTLSYTTTNGYTGEKKDLNYSIYLSSTKCNYSGLRFWMHCPLEHNGKTCFRRVTKLYRVPNGHYFGCRKCLNLTYHSKSTNYRNSLFTCFGKAFDMDEIRHKIKRKYYKGKPTKQMKRLIRMQMKYYPLTNDSIRKFNYNKSIT